MFDGRAVEVDGCRLLGFLIGKEKAYESFKVTTDGKYANLLKKHEQVVKASPQNAYASLTIGVQQILNFASRATPNSRNSFTDADAIIQTQVLASFFDSPVSQIARRLCSLPNRENRLNIRQPIDYETKYAASLTACAPLEHEDRAYGRLTQERINTQK